MKTFAKKINQKFYYGWVIVFVSAFSLFFSAPGQTYSISVFIDSYSEIFDYSSSLISLGYSIATLISGSLLVVMGKLTDKFGQRIMIMVVGLLLAITTFYKSFVFNIGMIFVGFFFLRYFGQGSMTLIPHSLVPQWFKKRRAFALSLETYGALIATLSVPAFNYWLIGQVGWENAWRFWGLGLLLVFIPTAFFTVINRPEDAGITVENEGNGTEEELKAELDAINKESFTLQEALHTKEFWFVGLMSIIVPMFTTGVTFHFFSMMSLRGVPPQAASFIIGLIALPAFIMPLVARILIDRYKPKYIFLLTQTMIFLSMVWLAFFVQSAISATGFILFYGMAVAIQQVTLNTLWPTYFGRKHLGAIRGAATVFMVLGTALGPLPLGLNYDLTGGYNETIFIMMALTVGAFVMALSIRKPRKEDHYEK